METPFQWLSGGASGPVSRQCHLPTLSATLSFSIKRWSSSFSTKSTENSRSASQLWLFSCLLCLSPHKALSCCPALPWTQSWGWSPHKSHSQHPELLDENSVIQKETAQQKVLVPKQPNTPWSDINPLTRHHPDQRLWTWAPGRKGIK